jgi:hypothetical protein
MMSAQCDTQSVEFHWGIKVPLRDGIRLNATVYRPKDQRTPAPSICALTPYVADHLHDRAVYFAARGLPFVAVDVRGRGNSEGIFRPNIQEAEDGYDVVEWLARQPYCNGKVAMYGGSYMGYAQWAAAKEFPPHLAAIVPTASPWMGIDFPMRNNLFSAYLPRWLTAVSGRTAQMKNFGDAAFWSSMYRQWYESGRPYRETDAAVGNPSPIFQEWLCHPELDEYWDSYNPTKDQYARLEIPILTITGCYDGDQPGALEHYRRHMLHGTSASRARHYLIIGPWDHAGTAIPAAEFGGTKVESAGVLDLWKLHRQWYAWTMQGGSRPEFLQKKVAYYVMGAERWRYVDTLESVTSRHWPLFLQSTRNPIDVFSAGALSFDPPALAEADHYLYDPRDVSLAALESTVDAASLVDQRLVHAGAGKRLIYHSAPFERDTEVSGFCKLRVWLSIDQPDTDFCVSIHDIDEQGGSMLLTTDVMRARYREDMRQQKPVRTTEPLRYDFERFTFVSRLIRKGHRLRLVIGPNNSIYSQRNYNSGGVVADESMKNARPVTVRLLHDKSHPSALYVPLGRDESDS